MKCPNCGNEMINTIGGCYHCDNCGYSEHDLVYRRTNIPSQTLLVGDPYVGRSGSTSAPINVQPVIPKQRVLDGCKCIIADDFEWSIDDQIEYYEKKLAELKAQKEKEKWVFTEDEKVILRNLPEDIRWIARCEDDIILRVFTDEPIKTNKLWEDNGYIYEAFHYDMFEFAHLFQCIQWSDIEPCEFRKYI